MSSRPLAWLCAIASLVTPALAQSRKLNAPLAREILGDVLDFRVTSDGKWAVYLAGESSGTPELFSVPTKGRTKVIGLTGPVTPAITAFELTPDGRTLVYQAEDLFRVPVDGTAPPLPLSDPVQTPGVSDFELAPQGGWVVYRNSTATELYSVPSDGSREPILLDLSSRGIRGFKISPDGETVVYTLRSITMFELWSVAIDGASDPVPSSGPNASFDQPVFRISPDSRRVVYRGDRQRNVFELFSAPLDASTLPVKLSGVLQDDGNVQQDFEIAADSQRVVFRADRDQDELFELYSAPISGRTQPVELNGALVAGGDVRSFRLTPDGKQAVYVADQEEDERFWLYRARIDGSAGAVRVGGGPPRFLEVLDYQLTAHSDRVVYRARSGQFNSTVDLYSAFLAGNMDAVTLAPGFVHEFALSPDGSAVALVRGGLLYNLAVVPSDGQGVLVHLSVTTGVNRFEFAPGGETVLFQAQADTYDVDELFSVPIDASREVQKLSGALLAGQVVGLIDSFQFDPAGKRIVYRAQGSTLDPPIVSDQACVVGLGPTAESLELFPWLPLEPNDLFRYVISPDGARLVFTAGNGPAEASALFSVPLDGSLPVVLLSDPSDAYFSLGRFEVTADARTVVYLQEDDEQHELYGVPIDRSSDPVELNGPLVEGGNVRSFVLAPDGERAVYLADQRTIGVSEPFAISLHGAGDPVPLIDDPPAHPWSSGVLSMSADGKRILFLADLVSDEVFELFALRLSGGDRVKLNAAPVAGGDVLQYVIAANAKSAVYLGDLESDETLELFGALLDGSAPPVKLSGPLAADRDVWGYAVAGDGSRAVYFADEETAGVFELYSAPVDGSAPRVKLNGPLVAGGNLRDVYWRVAFQVSPLGTHVVYQADQDTDEVIELYSAPIDGSAPPIKLSGALVSGGDVWTISKPAFAISPDGRWVVFQADKEADGVFELFAVAIDGSHAPEKLNGPLVHGGDVGPPAYGDLDSSGTLFGFSPDGRAVVYGADQETDEAFELFESPLPLLRKPRGSPAVAGR